MTVSNIIAPTKKICKSKLFKTAWSLIKKFNISKSVALKWAWDILKNGFTPVCEIEFVKKSTGEITKRVGTQFKLIEEKNGKLNLQFWSLTDQGFKKAIPALILSFKGYREFINPII